MSHTPGPWEFADGVISAETDPLIADVMSDRAEADGPLLAAAPDLLKWLKIMARAAEAGHALSPDDFEATDEVIAKAEGR